MTVNEFEQYKKIANKVINLLIQETHSSIKDIGILYNIIRGYPYCVSTEGQYTYKGQFYNSLAELPIEALQQIIEANRWHGYN